MKPLLAAGAAIALTLWPAPARAARAERTRSAGAPSLAFRATTQAAVRDQVLRSLQDGRRPPPLAAAPAAPASPRVCGMDPCPARIEVPFRTAGGVRRNQTDLALHYLARAPVRAVAAVADALVASGLRVDYAPPRGGEGTGWGKVTVSLHWQLNADNAPVLRAPR